MAQHGDIIQADELIIYSEATGYMFAWAVDDKEEFSGLAYLEVFVNSAKFPGISKMTINMNDFECWSARDVDALRKVAQAYLPRHLTR